MRARGADQVEDVVVQAVIHAHLPDHLLQRDHLGPAQHRLELLDRFAGQFVASRPSQARLEELTAREREVLLLVAEGLTNAEIADRLTISEATVKAHVGRILTKLDLRDRVQIVVMAYETGLVRPGS